MTVLSLGHESASNPTAKTRHLSTRLPSRLLAASLLLTAFGVSAHAAEPDAVRTVAVNAAGLDLNSKAGLTEMQLRIERAARRACDYFDVHTLREVADYTACHDAAVANASTRVQTLVARAASPKPVAMAQAGSPRP